MHPVGLVHVAHPVGAVTAFRSTLDVLLEGLPQAIELLRLVPARENQAAQEDSELEPEHDQQDGIGEYVRHH